MKFTLYVTTINGMELEAVKVSHSNAEAVIKWANRNGATMSRDDMAGHWKIATLSSEGIVNAGNWIVSDGLRFTPLTNEFFEAFCTVIGVGNNL